MCWFHVWVRLSFGSGMTGWMRSIGKESKCWPNKKKSRCLAMDGGATKIGEKDTIQDKKLDSMLMLRRRW